jgi:glycosyltransferase involved in cell wall biosynthesis
MILFDLSAAQPLAGGDHGGGEYARSVFARLLERNVDRQLVCLVDANRELPADIEAAVRDRGLTVRTFESKAALQTLLQSPSAQRFFSALPYHYGQFDFRNLEVVFTVHGLRPVEMPTDHLEVLYADRLSQVAIWTVKQLFTQAYRKLHLAKVQRLVAVEARRATVVVPSEHTKNALLTLTSVPTGTKVEVLYSPITGVAESKEIDRKRRFLLIVSGNRWIKNAWRALDAIAGLAKGSSLLSDLDIALTGGMPHLMRRRMDGRLKVLPYVSRSQLRALYTDAYALVYPSLNEGFGYPPLEAMACGTPVLSSDACSLPEIVGDAALYFDPRRRDQMADCIRRIVSDQNLWEHYRSLGAVRYQVVSTRQAEDLERLCDIIVGDKPDCSRPEHLSFGAGRA